jgi:hypothetical protein
MSDDSLGTAESTVDELVPRSTIWAGRLIPAAGRALDAAARDRVSLECVIDRGHHAEVAARVRFFRITRQVRHRRHAGSWVPEPSPSPDPVPSEVVREDVNAPLAELDRDDWLAFSATIAGDGSRRETESATPELIEQVSEPISWKLQLMARPFPGPHGLVRLRVRLANTTEPLTDLANRDRLWAQSMIGCHLILALDRGKFVPFAEPPGFAGPYLDRCDNDGTSPLVVGEVGKVLLAPVTGRAGSAPG